MQLLHPFTWILTFILCTLTTAVPLNASTNSTGPSCTTFTVPISVSALNANFPPDFTTSSLLSVVSAVGLVVFNSLVTDTYTISATYCEPEVIVESRRSTLQFLVHGATYTKKCEWIFVPGNNRKPIEEKGGKTDAEQIGREMITMSDTAGLLLHQSKAVRHSRLIVLEMESVPIRTLFWPCSKFCSIFPPAASAYSIFY